MTVKEPSEAEDALAALRVSESRYRRLFETARDGILLLNAATAQIEDVNPYLIELLGYSHAEFLGKKLWELGSFVDIRESREMFALLQDKGYVRYQNLPLKTRSQHTVAVEFVSNSYDCEGTTVIQCNIRDITVHIEADRVLQEYKAIVDASEDAIVSQSLDGQIKSWNAGAERLFGYSAQEAIGASIDMLLPPDRVLENNKIFERLIGGERPKYFETRRMHRDGSLIDVSVTISPILNIHGKLVGASNIARNISAQRQAESARRSLELQLHESQKMEAIGTLAGGIAHDFNNILATILGNVDLALLDTENNPGARRSIEQIAMAARRARDLVQQILSFSRRQPMERKLVFIADVVIEATRLLRATVPAGVHIKLFCEHDLPPVTANATQIQQVLINLVTNSMQAAVDQAQRIDIRLDSVVLDPSFITDKTIRGSMDLSHPTRVVRLIVSDIGPGMDDSTLARIFEPFFTTKPMGGGTGLGLSVVQGIIQSHAGALAVSSEVGIGTTFTIYLPAAQAPSPAAEEMPNIDTGSDESTAGARCRLLYIDDDDALVLATRRLLERRGYIVSAFTDAREAINVFRSDPSAFDLVVTDYNMPYLSGLEVANAIRDICTDLPVAVTSGFIDEKLLSLSKGAGVSELIVKPINTADLHAVLERLCRSSK